MYSIGVDVHKAYSHMTVMDEQGQVVRVGKVSNTVEAVEAFVAPFRDNAQAVLEAMRNWAVMYDMLERQLRAVYLAHPLKVRAIAEARIKTDRIDSKILAHLLRCDLLPTAYVRPRVQRVSQQILRQRMFLVGVRTMVKNRIHVRIDRQLDAREAAAQFSDLFGVAGLAWLRTVRLADVERRLLNAELALFEAVQERIGESDSLVRNLAAGDHARAVGAGHSGLGTLLRRLGGPRDRNHPTLSEPGEAQRLRRSGPRGPRIGWEGVSWASHEARQQVASVGRGRGGASCRDDRSGLVAVLRAAAPAERTESREGGHGAAPVAPRSSCPQPGAPVPEVWFREHQTATSDCPYEPPTGLGMSPMRVPKKG